MVLSNIRLRHQFHQFLGKTNETQSLDFWELLDDALASRGAKSVREVLDSYQSILVSVPDDFYSQIQQLIESTDADDDAIGEMVKRKVETFMDRSYYMKWILLKTWMWIPLSQEGTFSFLLLLVWLFSCFIFCLF